MLAVLDNYFTLNKINYINFDLYYSNISIFLNGNSIGYINDIKQIEQTGLIKFNEASNSFKLRYIDDQHKLILIEDFDLIDHGFAAFLQNIFNNIFLVEVNFGFIENKIFLIIFWNQTTNIYEIVSFNQEDDFVIEHLIEMNNNNIALDKNYINYIFQYITNNGLQKFISSGGYIKVLNNLLIKFYPVKFNTGKNQQIPQLKLTNKDNNQSNSNINNNPLMQTPSQPGMMKQNKNMEIEAVNREKLIHSCNPALQSNSFQNPNGIMNNFVRQNSFGKNLDNNVYDDKINERINDQENFNKGVNTFIHNPNSLNNQYQTVFLN